MSDTYGKQLRFVVFEVKVDDSWLAVPQAEDVAKKLGLEFVPYKKISTDLGSIDAERDADSVQAMHNGMGHGHMREGVVLRPPIEVRKNNGARIVAKHKREEFAERRKQPKVSPDNLQVLTEANAIADEWVTPMRLTHVLIKMPGGPSIEQTGDVIKAMLEDVTREASGEIIESREARKAISKKTAQLFKEHLKRQLVETAG